MKIECPHCHLTGEVSDLEIPAEGRHMDCPRCNTSFTVKRRTNSWSPDAMNTCPSCSFSTFSEETFDVCPQCGLICKDYNDRLRKQREANQLKRDTERLTQKFAPVIPPPPAGRTAQPSVADDRPAIPQPVRLVGSAVLAVAALLLLYGLWGVMAHSVTDIQNRMMEQSVDPDSKLKIFALHILPYWLWILFGGFAGFAAYQFLQLRAGAPALLEKTAWAGLAIVIGSQLAIYIDTVVGATTPLFYVTEFVSTLFLAVIWAAPVALLIWVLRQPKITSEFPGTSS